MRSASRGANLLCMILATALWGCMPVRGAGEKAPENSFSVMTYNIWDLNGKRPAVEDVVAVIRSEDVPDLVLLQEVRGEKMAFKISEALGLPHYVYHGVQWKKLWGGHYFTISPYGERGS